MIETKMKFTTKTIAVQTNNGIEQIEAQCLKRVAVHPLLGDKTGQQYIVTLINCGMGVISTFAMYDRPGKMKDAKALAFAIEEQVTEDIEVSDCKLLSKEAVKQLAILVAQFRSRKPYDVNNDSEGVLELMNL